MRILHTARSRGATKSVSSLAKFCAAASTSVWLSATAARSRRRQLLILRGRAFRRRPLGHAARIGDEFRSLRDALEHHAPAQPRADHHVGGGELLAQQIDRKSTRLNSSHQIISYSVFSFKKKELLFSL